MPDIAAAAFADTAFHAQFERRNDIVALKTQACQSRQGKFNHHRRAADDGDLRIGRDFFDIVRHETHMPLPALLGTVDRDINLGIFFFRPIIKQIVLKAQILDAAGTVDDR